MVGRTLRQRSFVDGFLIREHQVDCSSRTYWMLRRWAKLSLFAAFVELTGLGTALDMNVEYMRMIDPCLVDLGRSAVVAFEVMSGQLHQGHASLGS